MYIVYIKYGNKYLYYNMVAFGVKKGVIINIDIFKKFLL